MLTRQQILDKFPLQRAGAAGPAEMQAFLNELGAFALLRLEAAATVVAMTAVATALGNWTSSSSRGTGWTINTTAGTITVPVEDWYVCGFSAPTSAVSGITSARPFINGVVVPYVQVSAHSIAGVVTAEPLSFAVPIFVQAGQVVDLRTYVDAPQNVTLGPTAFWLRRML